MDAMMPDKTMMDMNKMPAKMDMSKMHMDMSNMPEMMVDLNASKEELMRQIMEYDFASFDLHLYLNSHPYDERALYLFNNCVEMSKKLREAYEPIYGPLTASASGPHTPFRWIVGPWPWEPEANV